MTCSHSILTPTLGGRNGDLHSTGTGHWGTSTASHGCTLGRCLQSPSSPPLQSTWQSRENTGPVPREAVRSLALPNGSVPFGNTQNLSGTIYLLNGDLNASAQLTGAVGRVSRHDVRKALSPMLGTCKWLDEWQPL